MSFVRYYKINSQPLPQCCKYLANNLTDYLLYVQDMQIFRKHKPHIIEESINVEDSGFVSVYRLMAVFDVDHLDSSEPAQIEQYIDATRPTSVYSAHQLKLLKLLARDRWYKGDFERLRKILTQQDVDDLISFACNVLWERGYENHYTLGQQLSIRITTKLIQSGLDFKHQNDKENSDKQIGTKMGRGWNDKHFEHFIASITSISDVIKRHKSYKKYIVLELIPSQALNIKRLLTGENHNFKIIENTNIDNLCAIEIDDDKNSYQYLKKFTLLIANKTVNVLFVTDVDFYMKLNNYLFYLYNSLKLYYYCLCNKFVFEKQDYEIIFLLNLIVSLEWHNSGHLNSFTLEKSIIYNPLELSTRRLNSIKRAASQSRQLQNDNEIKIDFIKGKRIKTGTHYGHRLVNL
ncbi:P47 [Perigonia lusca single nucleopolyhedrovirus]|uniref:p47 n=1 Tax=Perigonia lusca single nucleopolyhedrovirus TaxID=1675865 RepID=A0A0M3WN03_9ABAC|nr:P47 [Perigonia lusca single nucleopolyhedrovirus]AKN80560.1 P47 [Perigonia lusca single nucleopolyhedrovirus]